MSTRKLAGVEKGSLPASAFPSYTKPAKPHGSTVNRLALLVQILGDETMLSIAVMMAASAFLLPIVAMEMGAAHSAARPVKGYITAETGFAATSQSTSSLSCVALVTTELIVFLSVQSWFTRDERMFASVVMRIAPKLMAFTVAVLGHGSSEKLAALWGGALPVLGDTNALILAAVTWGSIVNRVSVKQATHCQACSCDSL